MKFRKDLSDRMTRLKSLKKWKMNIKESNEMEDGMTHLDFSAVDNLNIYKKLTDSQK